MDKKIKTLLVSDNELIRYGWRCMLEEDRNIEIVGDYARAEEALSQLGMLSPDIVVMDTDVKERDWIEATRHLKRKRSVGNTEVNISGNCEEHQAEAFQSSPANCLVNTNSTDVDLGQTIMQVYQNMHAGEESPDSIEEAVELVISNPTKDARLPGFIQQLEETFKARIMHTISWGSVVTIELWPSPPLELLEKVWNMADVEKVEVELTAKGAFSSSSKQIGTPPRLRTSLKKRIMINLAGLPTIAQQELEPALNKPRMEKIECAVESPG